MIMAAKQKNRNRKKSDKEESVDRFIGGHEMKRWQN